MPVCACGRRFEPGESYCEQCGRHAVFASDEDAAPAVAGASAAAPALAWAPPVPARSAAWPEPRPVATATRPPHSRLALTLVVALILTLVAAGSFIATLRATRVTDADRGRFLPPPLVAPSATPRPAPLAQVGAAALSRVVTIESQTDRGERFGTGWLLDTTGDFVTNDHVIAGEHGVRILDRSGAVHVASVMGTDVAQDIAVVRSADGFAADPLPIAKEADIPVPEPVVVLASTRATEHGDTTSATLSARHQSITVRPDQGDPSGPVVYDDMLLIDGQVIYQGNSGGPVLDGGGRVVGIITAASPSAPEGFAVPIARVIDELRAFAARPSP